MGAFEKQFKEVMAVVDALPQRAVIPDDVAKRWAKEIIRFEPDRAIWHARRAAVIGGSEAGEFALAALNERPAYKDLESLWRQKMLLDLPDYPNRHMKRGTALEPLAQAVYLKLTGHQSIIDSEEVRNIFSKPHKDHPHIGGNPDEVATANGLRIITDFKVRNQLDENKGVSLINGAQLHWYGLIHAANGGKPVDGYGLAELDIPSEMMDDLMKNPPADWSDLANQIAGINRPGFGMKVRYFPHNENLAKNLVRLTEQFWNDYVLTGTPYKNPKPKMPETMTPDDAAAVENAQNEFLNFKLAETVAKEKADEARATVMKVVDKYDLKEWPFEVSGLSTGISTKFNKDEAASDLLAKGVAASSISKGGGTANVDRMVQTLENHGLLSDSHYATDWDTRAIKRAMKEQGLSEEDYQNRSVRLGLSNKKADQPVREILEKRMDSHLRTFGQGATDSNNQSDNLALDLGSDDSDEPDSDNNLKLA